MGRGPNKPKRGSAFEKLQSEREAKGVEEDLERDVEEREERKQIRQEERDERKLAGADERKEREREVRKVGQKLREVQESAPTSGRCISRLLPLSLALFTTTGP